ncbi:hypothetical protein B9G69_005445 [Bdellovibrio sp. SKB1291214]|uniref:hypothetical protein n=1 Tax=Bdellovibrio sp. SKB1291214 TaxID=1732569 RepID=UPI000B517161|nr:hypothetical protein [Bdellovibrio sp. SKB1291214]UYL10019.1 hypothetical protein B9G69_005445 [Bdellovibrio sp. SKB1291214]
MNDPHLEPELSVGEIMKLYLSHWRMFAVFTTVLFTVSMIIYAVKIPYVATTSIIFNDSQNSSVQAFSTQFFGLNKSLQESKKGSSLLSKHIEYLKTREFFEAVLAKIPERGESGQISLEERKGYENLRDKYLKNITDSPESKIGVLQKIDRWTKAQLDSDFEIKITASTPDRATSLFLVNTVVQTASELLKKRELEEINRVEAFMDEQKKDADQKLVTIGKELSEVQNREQNLLPLASKDKIGDYVSELLVRANELKLKINQNSKMIAYLNKDRTPGSADNSMYGVGGQIENLKNQNDIMKDQLGQIQASINNLKSESRELPFQAQMAEDLKKKSELEFARYKELSTALAKLEAQKLSIGNRFEILESARWETTVPQIGLLALALLSVLISQFVGSLIIYFRYLWNPNVITAEASRNLVVFDGHSLDPRVIIENSKIKLNLKQPEKDETVSIL